MFYLSIVSTILIVVLMNVNCDGYPSVGYNFDPCRADEHCSGPRTCRGRDEDDDIVSCMDSIDRCYCMESILTKCSTSADCDTGDRCFGADLDSGLTLVCLSCRLKENDFLNYSDENPSTCDGIWLGRYTGDICWASTLDCVDGHICGELQSDESVKTCSFEGSMCFCLPRTGPKACSLSSTCISGERCAIGAEFESRTCISCGRVDEDEDVDSVDSSYSCETSPPDSDNGSSTPSAQPEESPRSEPTQSPNPSPTPRQSITSSPSPSNASFQPEDNSPPPLVSPIPPPPPASICIASKHLTLYGSSHLVYAVHRRGLVLCDESESCATPGHVVVYNKKPMTMSSYCSRHAVCSKRVMFVNSPRMSLGMRISSDTSGLQFTAFSARFVTSFEEYVLRFLVSAGL